MLNKYNNQLPAGFPIIKAHFYKNNAKPLGCPENAKSLKSQAPQGFSGCLDIENDEMNKKKFLSASPRVK